MSAPSVFVHVSFQAERFSNTNGLYISYTHHTKEQTTAHTPHYAAYYRERGVRLSVLILFYPRVERTFVDILFI